MSTRKHLREIVRVGEAETDPSEHEPWAAAELGRAGSKTSMLHDPPGYQRRRADDESGVALRPNGSDPFDDAETEGDALANGSVRPPGSRVSGIAPRRAAFEEDPHHTLIAGSPVTGTPNQHVGSETMGGWGWRNETKHTAVTPGLSELSDDGAADFGDVAPSAVPSTARGLGPDHPPSADTTATRGNVTSRFGAITVAPRTPRGVAPPPPTSDQLAREEEARRAAAGSAPRRPSIPGPALAELLAGPPQRPEPARHDVEPRRHGEDSPGDSPFEGRRERSSPTARTAAAEEGRKAARTPSAQTAPEASPVGQRRTKLAFRARYAYAAVALALVAGGVAATQVLAGDARPVQARGMLAPAAAATPIIAPVEGRLSKLLVNSGDQVERGQLLALLDKPTLSPRLAQQQRSVALLKEENTRSNTVGDELHDAAVKALRGRQALLGQGLELRRKQVERAQNRLQLLQARAGVEQSTVEEAQLAVLDAQAEVLSMRAQAADVAAQLAAQKAVTEGSRMDRDSQVRQAEGELEAALSIAAQVRVEAPFSGRVDMLLGTQGQLVQAGEELARLAPEDAPMHAVVFVPSEVAEALQPGARLVVEVPALSGHELGTAHASVVQIGSAGASATELQEALGPDAALISAGAAQRELTRVELSLLRTEQPEALRPHLNAGTRVVVRIDGERQGVAQWLGDIFR